MNAKPILFRPDNVRAIIAGRKWQTRRFAWHGEGKRSPWQLWQPGSLAWVREGYCELFDGSMIYRADDPAPKSVSWRRGIHMTKIANRLTLRSIAEPYIERLQDITPQDAIAEGIDDDFLDAPVVDRFALLWRSIHGARAWEANPEVVVLNFDAYLCNVERFTDGAQPIERKQ